MDTPTAIAAQEAPGAPAGAGADRPRSPAERQLAMLERLAELAMEVAEAIGRQVLASAAPPSGAESDSDSAPTSPVVPGDPALAFARASRAVRMTVALWSQLTREMQAQETAATAQALDARRDQATERRLRAERIVERVALDHFEAALPGEENDSEAAEAIRLVSREARERLSDEGLYGDLPDLPFSEIVARICADLGLAPDWPRLAGEYWAQAEIGGGAVGAPLAPFAQADRPATSPPPSGLPGGIAGPGSLPARWRRRREAQGGPAGGAAAAPTLRVRFVESPQAPPAVAAEPGPGAAGAGWPP